MAFPTNTSIPTEGDPSKNPEQRLATLGVSVHHLKHIFMESKVCGAASSSTGEPLSRSSQIHEIENLQGAPGVVRNSSINFICPVDGRQGAAYVHCLEGDDHVGKATHILSYTWSYSIGDITDTLFEYCQTHNWDPKQTYIWMDCLCINQHRVVEQKEAGGTGMLKFEQEFPETLRRIGRMLGMLAPWQDPVYLTRVWCIFELYCAHNEGCEVTIVMPHREKESLEQAIFGSDEKNINAVHEALAKTKVQNAKASIESDRLTILQMVEEAPGFAVLNHKVNDLLRHWVRQTVSDTIDKREKLSISTGDFASLVTFCLQTSKLLLATGEYDYAEHMALKALTLLKEHDAENEIARAKCFHSIGKALDYKGGYEEAIVMYQRALGIRHSILPARDPQIATSHNFIGAALKNAGKYDEALLECQKALAIRESTLGIDHSDTAFSYYTIGNILFAKGDLDGALEALRKALAIRARVLGTVHPQTARSQGNVGDVLLQMGNHDAALLAHERALDMRLAVLGQNHPDTAWSFYRIGTVQRHMSLYGEAVVNLRKALEIDERLLQIDHPDTATIQNEIGNVLIREGEYQKALVEYEAALRVRELSLGKNHPKTVETIENLAAVLKKIDSDKHGIVDD